MLSMLVIVAWGPVKKLVQLKSEKQEANTCLTSIDKKLHSGLRDKHEIPNVVATTQGITSKLSIIERPVSKINVASFIPAIFDVLHLLEKHLPIFLRDRKILV